MSKTCTKCKINKNHSEFRPRMGPKANKDGLNSSCRQCERLAKREYDRRKKEANPLKFCYLCQQNKHCSLFYSTKKSWDKNGHKCKPCIETILRRAQEDSDLKQFEFLVQHKDNTKRCSKCRLFKDYSEFWNSKHTTDGFYSSCIGCTNASRSKFKERIRKNQKDWRQKNLPRARKLWNDWDKIKRKTDVSYRLRRNVMHAIVASIRNYSFSNNKTERLTKAIFDHLPYTSEELKSHIESLWEPWMNWGNYGKYDSEQLTWQIDHIIPQSKLTYDSMDHSNFIKCWNLSNLQPLETIANIKKSNKIIDI